ncbi:hypothetical protein J7J74_00045 [bacterium]|nr:hypothetical protein [bacterium]
MSKKLRPFFAKGIILSLITLGLFIYIIGWFTGPEIGYGYTGARIYLAIGTILCGASFFLPVFWASEKKLKISFFIAALLVLCVLILLELFISPAGKELKGSKIVLFFWIWISSILGSFIGALFALFVISLIKTFFGFLGLPKEKNHNDLRNNFS